MTGQSLSREFYIPNGAVKVCDKQSSAVVYLYALGDKPYALGFHGKARKPDFHYRYGNTQKREKSVVCYFESVRAHEKARKDRAAERASYVCDYAVGDILHTCWGYDQTNVEYFEVVEVRGKHVVLREIARETQETEFMQGNCVPIPGKYIGEPFRRLAQKGSIRIDSVRYARRVGYDVIAGMKVYRVGHYSSYA